MRRCSPVPPVVPPVSRFPRCAKPRKSVITVNGLSPDADGNVNAGDVRREDFSGVETKERMTLNEVGAKVNEVIGRLGGAADAAAASPRASVYGPGTPLGDVHPDTALRDVVEAAGMSADDVRAIASEVVAPVAASVTNLRTSKLDRADVVDPSSAAEDGKAADAKKTKEELDRILGVASGALALAESKADKLSSRQLEAVNSGIDASKVAKIAQNESAISAEVSRATTEEARLQALINAIKTFDAVVADSLPVPSEQYSKKLYLVPSTNPETRNVKDEFICVKIEDVWKWEQVGSTAITIEFDNEPTEGSQKVARSGGIWSWVKSLLPRWLTSDYAEPATVESVAKKADQSALATHIMDSSNPHKVTAGQIGAVPLVEDKNGDKTAVTIGSRKSGEPVGLGSLANGGDTTASGDFSHAEGRRTTASGHFSHAEGNLTTASGNYSHAEGYLSQTKKGDAHAFAWNGDNSKTEDDPYKSHGPGTFNINPIGGLDGFYIGDRKFSETLANKADKTTPYADGNLAALTADGNLRDSGRKESDFAPAVEGGYLPLNVGGTVNGDTTFIGSLYAGPLGDILGVTHDAGYLYKHDSVKWYYGGYDKEDANEIAVKGDVSGLESSKADKSELTAHTENTDNPHGVTAEQVGALSISRANTDQTFDWDHSGGGVRLFGTYYGTGIGLSLNSGGGELFNYHDDTYDWYKLPTGESGTLAVKGDISAAISATNTTFSNEVATVARTVTPPPSPTLRLFDEVRQCYWIGRMVNGVINWEVE